MLQQKYILITRRAHEVAVSANAFIKISESDKFQFYCDKDPFVDKVHFLIDKRNECAIAAYKALHCFDAMGWRRYNRLARCLDESGNLCTRDCRLCNKKRESRIPVSLEEREENGITHRKRQSAIPDALSEIIREETIVEMRNLIEKLKDDERNVLKALYGMDKPLQRVADYAKSTGLPYTTVIGIRDRAYRNLRNLVCNLKG